MSNPLKAVGKIFKKVVKVVKKVAIPALMIGAVVLTGGAALGALPALGTILGSVGITGTLASVLGGAISMGAIGAVTGGIGGALSGKGFMKGATGGFLVGAATGGIMGGLGMVGANGILGAAKGATTAAASAPSVGAPANTVMAQAAGASGVPAAATGVISEAGAMGGAMATGTAAPAAAAAAKGGLLSAASVPMLLQGAGQIISGFAAGKSEEKMMRARIEAEQEMSQDEYDRIAYNYGYRNVYAPKSKPGDLPIRTDPWYQYAPLNLGAPDQGLLRTAFSGGQRAPYYQIINGQVVAVGG